MLDGMLQMRTSVPVMVLSFINLSHIIANKQYINIDLIPISTHWKALIIMNV